MYLRSGGFQDLLRRLEERFARLLGAEPQQRRISSGLIDVGALQRSAYVDRFPQLVANVTPHQHSGAAAGAAVALLPSACLCLYEDVAALGEIGPTGLMLAVTAPCHRLEQSYSPSRMRAFTMSELVFFGTADQVMAFRARTLQAAHSLLRDLDLDVDERAANDPFFGRGGELMAKQQRLSGSKTEIVAPMDADGQVACFSFNLHGEFFSQRWDIRLSTGELAHSACFGVGLERFALALVSRHGSDFEAWPTCVKQALERGC